MRSACSHVIYVAGHAGDRAAREQQVLVLVRGHDGQNVLPAAAQPHHVIWLLTAGSA